MAIKLVRESKQMKKAAYGITKEGFKRLSQSKQVPERDIKEGIMSELEYLLNWIEPAEDGKAVQMLKSLINNLSSNTVKIVVSSYDTGSPVPDYDSEEDGDYESFLTRNNID